MRVIAGLDPAIPIVWHGRAFISGMAGLSPAMTTSKELSVLQQHFADRVR